MVNNHNDSVQLLIILAFSILNDNYFKKKLLKLLGMNCKMTYFKVVPGKNLK